MIQYRITWGASSNISFHGETDWKDWYDEDATAVQVEKSLCAGKMTIDGLEEALNASGFEWLVETREVSGGDQES